MKARALTHAQQAARIVEEITLPRDDKRGRDLHIDAILAVERLREHCWRQLPEIG